MKMSGRALVTAVTDNGIINELIIPSTTTVDYINLERLHPNAAPRVTITFIPDKFVEWSTRYTPPLVRHEGPTEDDPDPKKIWHTGCGGEVYYLGGVYTCNKCRLTDKGDTQDFDEMTSGV